MNLSVKLISLRPCASAMNAVYRSNLLLDQFEDGPELFAHGHEQVPSIDEVGVCNLGRRILDQGVVDPQPTALRGGFMIPLNGKAQGTCLNGRHSGWIDTRHVRRVCGQCQARARQLSSRPLF